MKRKLVVTAVIIAATAVALMLLCVGCTLTGDVKYKTSDEEVSPKKSGMQKLRPGTSVIQSGSFIDDLRLVNPLCNTIRNCFVHESG